MFAILKKEVSSFFSSPIGYLVTALFLIGNGLFLWIFSGGYNILDAGFADLSSFFQLAPWVFLFLIPALCMKSFSEEYKQGTFELLLSLPVTKWQLVLGKYFGAVVLIIVSLLPTLVYLYTIDQLGRPVGNFDSGAVMGSYLGLLLLGASYAAIGVFSSSISQNQIVGFIIAVFLCFLCFFGLEALSELGTSWGQSLSMMGLGTHYQSISRGVIDSRDLIYFLSFMLFFLCLTRYNLDYKAS